MDRTPITQDQLTLLRCRVQSISVRVHEMAEEIQELVRDLDSLCVVDFEDDTVSSPEPKPSLRMVGFRPFRNGNEFEIAVGKHGGAVYRKHTTIARRNEPATRYHEFAIGSAGIYVDGNHYLWEDLYSHWAFSDGTPCGQPINQPCE